MCTVTYLPTKEGYILTSNRDEALARKPASNPVLEMSEKYALLFPRDGDAGGTWVATANNARTVCLLNGAFERHKHRPPYRKSRGLVVLDFFDTNSAADFYRDYDLSGIEPFTLLIIEGKELFEFRWDGNGKYFKPLDSDRPHIRCSVTLYTPEVITMRQKWFARWLTEHNGNYRVKDILSFHLFAGDDDERTRIRMSIFGIVKTVSITCIEQINDNTSMFYSDLSGEKNYYFGKYGLKPDLASVPDEGLIIEEDSF